MQQWHPKKTYSRLRGAFVGAWLAGASDAWPWIQADLGEELAIITGVITQGRPHSQQYVTSYQVHCVLAYVIKYQKYDKHIMSLW